MQGDNSELMKGVEKKLEALVHCVIKKARDDKEFAAQLQEILLSDSLRESLREKKSSITKIVFNPVSFLQDHGRERLREELESKPKSELYDIVRSYRIVKGKPVKDLDRTQILEEILGFAEKSLNRGGAFLRDKRPSKASGVDNVNTPGGVRSKEGTEDDMPPPTGTKVTTEPGHEKPGDERPIDEALGNGGSSVIE